ncbi:MAG: hypothetical protein ACM3PX_07785 [Omnitrophica WOR_2 bacterium]|jgi:hypothetical protein
MDKMGTVEIRIIGSKGNIVLSPDSFDISEIRSLLETAENLLYPGDKKNRPTISYDIKEGSVKHIFKTSLQYIIAFNAIIGQVKSSRSLDFLESSAAEAFQNIQSIAVRKDYTFEIQTSIFESNILKVDKTTSFYISEAIWADAEFYFYGKITNAGGKDKANIHIFTEEYGTVIIRTPITFLESLNENLLYKSYGVRAIGKQHSETGEIDKSSLEFIEIIDYQTGYDEIYLKKLRDKAKQTWLGTINPDQWLSDLRDNYEA